MTPFAGPWDGGSRARKRAHVVRRQTLETLAALRAMNMTALEEHEFAARGEPWRDGRDHIEGRDCGYPGCTVQAEVEDYAERWRQRKQRERDGYSLLVHTGHGPPFYTWVDVAEARRMAAIADAQVEAYRLDALTGGGECGLPLAELPGTDWDSIAEHGV